LARRAQATADPRHLYARLDPGRHQARDDSSFPPERRWPRATRAAMARDVGRRLDVGRRGLVRRSERKAEPRPARSWRAPRATENRATVAIPRRSCAG